MGISALRFSMVVLPALAAAAPCLAQVDIPSMSLHASTPAIESDPFEPFTSGALVFVDHGDGVAVCEYFETPPWAPQDERMVSVPNTVPSPGAIALAGAALLAFSAPRRRPAR
jgi:hypothetical protein